MIGTIMANSIAASPLRSAIRSRTESLVRYHSFNIDIVAPIQDLTGQAGQAPLLNGSLRNAAVAASSRWLPARFEML